jgi:short-subunit dehydrogenase
LRKVVAITGASSGIGAEFARRLAPDHDLLLIARRPDKLQELAAKLTEQHDCQVETLAADLSADAGIAAVAEKIKNHLRLTLLINNAGFGARGRFWESPLAVQDQMHMLHVMATVRLTHAALQNLVAQDAGAVINVASVAAFIRSQGAVSYGASKTWMTTFTEGLYLDLKGAGSRVRVQALCPGFTYTGFHEAMGADRSNLAGSRMWMTAEQVVDASLNGLLQNRLFVIPGWRYRLIAALLPKLPSAFRLQMETVLGQRRAAQILQQQAEARRLAP